MRIPVLASLVALALSASAEVTIGNYTLAGDTFQQPADAPYTIIDLNSGATENGTIAAVAVRTFGAPCADAFRVRFYRPGGGSVSIVAERGPFAVNGGITKVTMTPPVNLRAGDLIGIVAQKPCMRVTGQAPVTNANAVQFPGIIDAVDLSTGTPLPHFALAAYGAASTTAEVRTQVIPVAGAAPGVNGASFKTDVFLMNPRNTASAGRLVYHPEQVSAAPTDPFLSFSIEPSRSLTFENFVNGLDRIGKGSVDVYTIIGYEPPYVNARIYDDAGLNGTKGFSMDAQTIGSALQPFEQGVLFTPADDTRFRMNIGVRTLDQSAEIDFLLLDANGIQRALVKKTYPANYYTQTDAPSLLGATPHSGDTIIVYPRTSPVFVYGSIIDNTTNDPSAQIAKTVK